MFLKYNDLKKFLIGEMINNTTVDEYIKSLNNLGLMPVILENVSLEIATLSNDIIYDVFFNSEFIGFIERNDKVDYNNQQVKLEILEELLINDKNCKNRITNLIIDYNVSKLNFIINTDNLSLTLGLQEIIDDKQKFNDTLYKNYCNVLHEIYYDKTLIGSYTEFQYYYSNSWSNDFNDCTKEVNKTIPEITYNELQWIINKMKLENIKLKKQIRNHEGDKVKVKKK